MPGSHYACNAVAWFIRQAQDVRDFIEHLRRIHIALDKHGFVYFKSASGFGIVAEPERPVKDWQRFEPGIVKQIFVPEVLVGINDFHGSFEGCDNTRLNLPKCRQHVNKVRTLN
jgi:hypothetical protein